MSGKFTAYVYEKDLRKIQKLVQPYPDIETGGDLFGLWQDERTVIIQRFIGPGEKRKRTPTSFHQDVEYLHRVGSLITAEEGLCNVGEWHSHHQIGMPQPSGADRRTVFSNMPQLGLERFVLFIATIEKASNPGKKRSQEVKLDEIKIRPFLFIDSQQKVLEGKIEIIPGKNPHNMNVKTENEIIKGAEKVDNKRRVSTSSDENFDRAEHKSDKGHNGKSTQDPRTRQQQDSRKIPGSKGRQTLRGNDSNIENRSPNSGSPAPSGRGYESPTVFSPSSQNAAAHRSDHSIREYMPSTTSAPTASLAKTWDDSLKFQTAQQRGQELPRTGTQVSQAIPYAPSSSADRNAGATQKRGGGTGGDFPRLTKSPTFQPSQRSKPPSQAPGEDGRLNVDISTLNAKGNF